MKCSFLLLVVALVGGCAANRSWHSNSGDLGLPRIERELNFYVATHPLHESNHFFAYPTDFRHGEPVGAEVYWKEERTLLHYSELEPDATHDIFAWSGHELKLDRDTVDTRDDIGGSSYLVTHRQWAESVERCISRGKEFSILKTDARRLFPDER